MIQLNKIFRRFSEICLITFSFFLITNVLNSQVKWNVTKDTSYKWYYAGGDEFNMNFIDDKKWITSLPWSRNVVSSGTHYLDENTFIDSGFVFFKLDRYNKYEKLMEWEKNDSYLKKHPERQKDDMYLFDYSAGLIWSKQKYKYGQFEIRFISPDGSGIWPAFWLYGGEPNYEIDFFELKGEKNNYIHVDVHCPNGCSDYRSSFFDLSKGWGRWIKTTNYFNNQYNVVSGIWEPEGISFFLNGIYIGYYKGNFNKSMNLTTGIGIAQNDGPFKPGENKNTIFPSLLKVDYIRVWSDQDTVYDLKDNYQFFEFSNDMKRSTKDVKSYPVSKKIKNAKPNKYENSVGTITLLPILYNKYSLSFQGNNFGKVQVDVFDRFNAKVAGFGLENVEYYIMDLSALPTGPYKVKINVAGQILEQDIPIINPEKVGEQD